MVIYVHLHFLEPLIQAVLIGKGLVTVLRLFRSLGLSVWRTILYIDMTA